MYKKWNSWIILFIINWLLIVHMKVNWDWCAVRESDQSNQTRQRWGSGKHFSRFGFVGCYFFFIWFRSNYTCFTSTLRVCRSPWIASRAPFFYSRYSLNFSVANNRTRLFIFVECMWPTSRLSDLYSLVTVTSS